MPRRPVDTGAHECKSSPISAGTQLSDLRWELPPRPWRTPSALSRRRPSAHTFPRVLSARYKTWDRSSTPCGNAQAPPRNARPDVAFRRANHEDSVRWEAAADIFRSLPELWRNRLDE